MPGSRGLPLSRKQCCDILGWTDYQFDKAVRGGMRIADHPKYRQSDYDTERPARQTDYIVFMGDVIDWIVEEALKAAGHEPDENKPLDLNAERARLAKEQADKTAMDNSLARGELARIIHQPSPYGERWR